MKNFEQTKICQLCGKGPRIGFNRPKSLHKTKKLIFPNLQKYQSLILCTRCRRTLKKNEVKTAPAA